MSIHEPYRPDGEDSFERHRRIVAQRQARAAQHAQQLRGARPKPSDYGIPIRWGDDATRSAHERKCQARRRAMLDRQFEVAPMHTVFTASGERLAAGMQVTTEHFLGAPLAPGAVIEWLVSRGVVLESLDYSREPEPPEAA